MDDNFTQPEEPMITTENDLKIYSKQAIIGFTLFFSTIFGAVLLMQNLKDIGKRKEATILLFLSIIYTAISICIINIPDRPNAFLTYLCNFIGAMILTEFIYKKNFPDDEAFEKKKVWKPLIISILIIIPFALAMISSL